MLRFDTVIKGGTVIDGLRTPRFVADIGIRDGRIALIGRIDKSQAGAVIDARGAIVAPGFVDLHTHYDSQIFWDPYCTISGWHGVTSVVVGNCGFGFAPCRADDRIRSMLTMSRNEAVPFETMEAGMPWDWQTYPEFLDSLERTPKGVNIMSYLPLSPLLVYVMGIEAAKSRPANEAERLEMARLFREALDAGACGFSIQYTGTDNVQRDYDGTPMVTDTMAHDDLLMFARVLRERGEGFIQVACPIDVAEELAEVSGRPVVWNALTATTDQHGVQAEMGYRDVIARIEQANQRGNRLFAQTVTNGVSWWFTLEDWNLYDSSPLWRQLTLGDHRQKIAAMTDPALRRQLREEYDSGRGPVPGGGTEDNNALGFTGLAGLFIIGTGEKWRRYEGCTLSQLATGEGKHLIDAFLDLAVDEDLQTEFQTPVFRPDRDAASEVVRFSMGLPGISDGGAHTKFLTMATYPTEFLIDHVRDDSVMDLEEAHWRLSAYPAQAAGLRDRGALREGMPADIIVYNLDGLSLGDTEVAHDFPADQWRRVRRAHGYRYILVNGELTFVDGESTGAHPGKLLRHGADAAS